MGKGNKAKDRQVNQQNKKNDRLVKGALKKRRERSKHGDEKWKQGLRAFNNQLESQGLIVKDVAGDGNCLFRAISDQLEDSPNNHKKYRKEIIAFVEMNKEMYAPFIDDEEYDTFEEYIDDMKLDGTWGGNVEVQACSLIYNVNVVIHQIDQPTWEINNHFKPKSIIHLSFHNGEHYASVRSIKETFFPQQKQAPPTANLQLVTFADLEKNRTEDENDKKKSNTKDVNSGGLILTKDQIDPEIYDIMVATGIKSVKLIREALEDCQYNHEATIDYLISLSSQIDIFGEDDDDSSNGKTTTTTTTTTTSTNKNEKVSKNPYKGIKKKENEDKNNSSNSQTNEHLSNKQRKALNNNNNNQNSNKKKQTHNINLNEIVDDSIPNLGSLNI